MSSDAVLNTFSKENMKKIDIKTDKNVPGSWGAKFVGSNLINHNLTYGPHLLKKYLSEIDGFETIVDIGSGEGRDLGIARFINPDVKKTIAIEASQFYADEIKKKVDEVHVLNIENSKFPFKNESIDFLLQSNIRAYQRNFWIFHEITRSLKVGGRFFFRCSQFSMFT